MYLEHCRSPRCRIAKAIKQCPPPLPTKTESILRCESKDQRYVSSSSPGLKLLLRHRSRESEFLFLDRSPIDAKDRRPLNPPRPESPIAGLGAPVQASPRVSRWAFHRSGKLGELSTERGVLAGLNGAGPTFARPLLSAGPIGPESELKACTGADCGRCTPHSKPACKLPRPTSLDVVPPLLARCRLADTPERGLCIGHLCRSGFVVCSNNLAGSVSTCRRVSCCRRFKIASWISSSRRR